MNLILKYSIAVFLVPFLLILDIMIMEKLKVQLLISIFGMIVTIITVFYCKIKVRDFIKPSDEILEKIGVQPRPVEYSPNKYKKSSKVFEYTTYLIVFSHVFAYLSYKYSYIAVQPGGHPSLIIKTEFFFLSMIFLITGLVSFVLWAKLKQAYYIFNEKDALRRAKLNGFATAVERQAQKLNLYYQLSKMVRKR